MIRSNAPFTAGIVWMGLTMRTPPGTFAGVGISGSSIVMLPWAKA